MIGRPSTAVAGLTAAIAVAGLLAGCGAASSATTAATTRAAAATTTPAAAAATTRAAAATTTAAAPPAPRISRRLRAREAALHRQVTAALHHGGGHARYGGLPRDLRGRQAPPADQVLTATPTHPARAIQGNGVRLRLAHGSALATVVGPDVPTAIQGTAAPYTPATWVVTFARVHGTVPLAPTMFSIVDEQGQLLAPRVSVAGGGGLPSTAPSGRALTLRLSARVSVGDGKLRYAPTGGRWLADWDFTVETD